MREDLTIPAAEPANILLHPLPNRKRVLLLVGELFVAAGTASLVSAAIQWTVNRLPIERQSNEPRAITWTVVFVLSCAIVALLWKRWSPASTAVAWMLPAALPSTVLGLELFGTPFYLFGTNGDQLFRVQYLQRLTFSPSLADGTYPDIPPFYPAGWFWLGGRFANVIGDPAWVAYKPFAILTIAVASSLSYVLWSLVVSRRTAFGVGAAVALAGTVIGSYEPYSWFAIVLVPPLAVLAWRLFTCCAHGRSAADRAPATVLIGVGISITAATYTLVFGFAVLLMVTMAIAAVLSRAKNDTVADDRVTVRSLALPMATRLVLIGMAALPITLLAWGPYLLSAIRQPTARNAAAQFFSVGMASLDTPMLRPSLTGVVCMIGVFWVILAWTRSTVAQALGITVLTCVVWQLLSTLALAADTTLLSSRIAKVGEVALWCACAFAVVDFSGRIKLGGRHTAQVLVSVLAVLVAVELAQTTPRSTQNLVDGAFASYDEDGRAITPSRGPAPGRFNKRLIDAIADMSRRQPHDNVVLTNNYQLLVFRPYYNFQANKEQYANPLALYPERNREIIRWAKSTTAVELVSTLRSSQFRTPNVFIFRRDDEGNYTFRIVSTQFPKENKTTTITFPARIFESPDFDIREIGPFTVIVRP